MIKYKTGSVRYRVEPKIEKIEVERETKSTVWIKGRAERKHGEYHDYHDTWKEARDFLVDNAYEHIDDKTNALEFAEKALDEVMAMEEK